MRVFPGCYLNRPDSLTARRARAHPRGPAATFAHRSSWGTGRRAMCGIFGFAGFEQPDLLRRMGDVLRHRGPDGEGYFHEGRFSLGMRRLAIIDLEGGGQPMFDEDERLALVSNGEIYNYVELRADLD